MNKRELKNEIETHLGFMTKKQLENELSRTRSVTQWK